MPLAIVEVQKIVPSRRFMEDMKSLSITYDVYLKFNMIVCLVNSIDFGFEKDEDGEWVIVILNEGVFVKRIQSLVDALCVGCKIGEVKGKIFDAVLKDLRTEINNYEVSKESLSAYGAPGA